MSSALFFAAYSCCRETLSGGLAFLFGADAHSLVTCDVENGLL